MRVESQELEVGSRGMMQVRCGDVENFQCYPVVMGMPSTCKDHLLGQS